MSSKNLMKIIQSLIPFGIFFCAVFLNYNIMPSVFNNSPDFKYLSYFFKKVIIINIV